MGFQTLHFSDRSRPLAALRALKWLFRLSCVALQWLLGRGFPDLLTQPEVKISSFELCSVNGSVTRPKSLQGLNALETVGSFQGFAFTRQAGPEEPSI